MELCSLVSGIGHRLIPVHSPGVEYYSFKGYKSTDGKNTGRTY